MNNIKTVCVYCGSGPGTNPRFVEAAIALGKALAENGIRLVYGGGSIGLMSPITSPDYPTTVRLRNDLGGANETSSSAIVRTSESAPYSR